MTTRIIIARHGNTFTKDQTPTRVGGRTDLPLVEEERGTLVGQYLADKGWIPDKVWAAPLKRTMKTAELAVKAMGLDCQIEKDDSFREIDYGPDENKTEDAVIARIGQEAIDKWNAEAIVPDGWKVDVQGTINAWMKLGDKVFAEYKNKNVLVVSSNGVIRFAPYLTGDFAAFSQKYNIKVGTGCVCVFEKEDGDKNWRCVEWNVKPKDYFKAK